VIDLVEQAPFRFLRAWQRSVTPRRSWSGDPGLLRVRPKSPRSSSFIPRTFFAIRARFSFGKK
jgi:hypothetical protein